MGLLLLPAAPGPETKECRVSALEDWEGVDAKEEGRLRKARQTALLRHWESGVVFMVRR